MSFYFKKWVDSVNKKQDTRLPDFGPCEIEDWDTFLINSKEIFDEKWNKPLTHKETLGDFQQQVPLACGSFGNVILIKQKENGIFYAMKAIAKEKIIENKRLDQTKNEKMILQCIDFPFTVCLKFYFKDNSYIYFVMPFVPGGELVSYLYKAGKLDEIQAMFYVSQVILALEYLHYLDLIYRNLKPENILIDHTGYLKVTDFGFSKRLQVERTFTVCGAPDYMAPEMILRNGYGKSVDWWGVGVLMYELVAGITPFYANRPLDVYANIIGVKYKMPKFFSHDLKDLIKNILQINSSRRYGNLKNGVKDIKNHKWFRPINWLTVLNRKMEVPFKPKYGKPGDTLHFKTACSEPLTVSKENKYVEEFAEF